MWLKNGYIEDSNGNRKKKNNSHDIMESNNVFVNELFYFSMNISIHTKKKMVDYVPNFNIIHRQHCSIEDVNNNRMSYSITKSHPLN